jgi:hypothetical protein
MSVNNMLLFLYLEREIILLRSRHKHYFFENCIKLYVFCYAQIYDRHLKTFEPCLNQDDLYRCGDLWR